MANYFTKTCGTAGHPEIGFAFSEESNPSVDWLLSYFESEVANGRRFQAGETVQVGWMIVELKEAPENSLEIWEPDFDSMPIRWCRGVNNTLRHLVLQKSICDEIACEPDFPSLRQPSVISPNFLTTPNDFVMSRDLAVGGDSGWVFHEPGYSGNEGKFVSLFEIALYHMEIIPFLALPPGTSVIKSGGVIEVTCVNKQISSRTNSLLGKVAKARILV